MKTPNTSREEFSQHVQQLAEGIQGEEGLAIKNFNEIWKLCKPVAESIVRQFIFNESYVEDVIQDVFLKCWTKRAAYVASKGSFLVWLIRVARNSAIDAIRSLNRRNKLHLQFTEVEARRMTYINNSHLGEQRDYVFAIIFGLEKYLNHKSLETIRMYTLGCTMDEIASAKNEPVATVKARFRRLKDKVARLKDEV